MAHKKRAADEVDMDLLREEFRKVGADYELGKAILDMAQSESQGMVDAFDNIVRRTAYATAQREAARREMDVEEAGRVLDRDYTEDVNEAADEVVRRWHEDDERGDIGDVLHQVIDGRQRVIYTHLAQLGLAFSKNDDVYFEDNREWPELGWSTVMYAAMERDVVETLGARGFDVDNPPDTEDEEEDET